jgi:oligopeptide/dipeptide ABC transporter ATP-binding protein
VTPEPLLSVRDLSVEIPTRRGTVQPIDGISFELAEGETLGLVGESGCGKSMTLRAIMGLLPRRARITSGHVRFRGRDLVALEKDALRDVRGRSIAMIFQEPMTALNPVMPVGEQIAEGPIAHLGSRKDAARTRALELMRSVGIPDPRRRFDSFPHELSGGMRQRVMIAIALSCEPELILCDEPTTALDVTIQDQILKLLLALQESAGIGVIFVTHDLAVVAQMCRSVAVMYAAQIVEAGSVESVFAEPVHPYTLGLLRAVPDFDKVKHVLDPIPGIPPDLIGPPAGCRFRPRCAFAREDCAVGEFPLTPVEADRSSACIHWPTVREAVRADPVIPVSGEGTPIASDRGSGADG